MGTCLAPSGLVGVVVDTTSDCIDRVGAAGTTGVADRWRSGCAAGSAARRQRYPVALRRAVKASRRWFH